MLNMDFIVKRKKQLKKRKVKGPEKILELPLGLVLNKPKKENKWKAYFKNKLS
jgi:hypothetical protein